MEQREEIITRLHDEDESLDRQIQTLQEEAEHRNPGIRQYRHQRVGQLRDRQHALRAKMRRVVAQPDDAWDNVKHEAEQLWLELRDVATVAARTFH